MSLALAANLFGMREAKKTYSIRIMKEKNNQEMFQLFNRS
jgi:hypothetical protein